LEIFRANIHELMCRHYTRRFRNVYGERSTAITVVYDILHFKNSLKMKPTIKHTEG